MLQSAISLIPRQPVSSSKHSPAASTQLERHDQGEASSETLVAWLVAAKRSLASIHHVHRATTILTEARAATESTATLIARTKYVRRSLHSQLKILRGIQFELEGSAHNIKQDIYATNHQLEIADRRLKANIEILQNTKVEDGFRSKGFPEHEQKHVLHDFIDNAPLLMLEQEIKGTATIVESAQDRVNASIRDLEDRLQSINEVLADRTATSSCTKSDLQPFNIYKQMRSLEIHASEMAQSLESLVSHYDLCVTAIKHTEGADVMVARQIRAAKLPEEVGHDIDSQEPEQPMSEEERVEMIRVLANDAEQVDDEAMDIVDRALSMEAQLDRLKNWQETHLSAHKEVKEAFRLMEQVSEHVPAYVEGVADFNNKWQEERAKLEDSIVALEDLSVTYESFLSAYDYMIVEAGRRRQVRRNMERIVADAQALLDRLHEEDARERELFRIERGDFLPSDIWEGLNSIPTQYTWHKATQEGVDSVPELDKSVIVAAVRRLKANMVTSGER